MKGNDTEARIEPKVRALTRSFQITFLKLKGISRLCLACGQWVRDLWSKIISKISFRYGVLLSAS